MQNQNAGCLLLPPLPITWRNLDHSEEEEKEEEEEGNGGCLKRYGGPLLGVYIFWGAGLPERTCKPWREEEEEKEYKGLYRKNRQQQSYST